MAYNTGTLSTTPRFPLPALDLQADLAEKHGLETLLFKLVETLYSHQK